MNEFISEYYTNARAAIVTYGVNDDLYDELAGTLDGLPKYTYQSKPIKDQPARYVGGKQLMGYSISSYQYCKT